MFTPLKISISEFDNLPLEDKESYAPIYNLAGNIAWYIYLIKP